jgi:Rrf2 family iron-sulfur cluster assembly transcriptional regulator
MLLTRGGEYGLRGVLYLARQDSDKVSMVSAIAEAQAIPPRFLAKIFQALAKAGVVKSRRGAKGGFSLRRPASDITVKEVIEAIEGPMSVHCDTTRPLRDILEKAQAKMMHVLSEANFADLANIEYDPPALALPLRSAHPEMSPRTVTLLPQPCDG